MMDILVPSEGFIFWPKSSILFAGFPSEARMFGRFSGQRDGRAM